MRVVVVALVGLLMSGSATFAACDFWTANLAGTWRVHYGGTSSCTIVFDSRGFVKPSSICGRDTVPTGRLRINSTTCILYGSILKTGTQMPNIRGRLDRHTFIGEYDYYNGLILGFRQ